jgi:hypothetical protein
VCGALTGAGYRREIEQVDGVIVIKEGVTLTAGVIILPVPSGNFGQTGSSGTICITI